MADKRDIVFKVVRKDSRKSAVVGRKYHDDRVKEKFALTYEPNTLVKAPTGSLGVFCFRNYFSAENWARDIDTHNILIIKVSPWGRELKIPDRICIMGYTFDEILEQYKYIKSGSIYKPSYTSMYVTLWTVPTGSVCYQGVRVLE
jgi:SepF-like predicted cell division protein (DUF552 family)